MGLFGDCSDCTEKKKTISSLQNSNKQKDDTINQKEISIKQKEISIKQNESTIKLIEDQLAQAKNEIATKQNQIKSQVSEIQELKTKIEELKKENDEYTKRISDLEVQEANSVSIISDLKIKDDTKSKKILELLGNLQQKEEADNEKVNEISQLNEKMKRFEEAKNDKEVEVKQDELPSVCIHMDSLLSLNDPQKGWKIVQNKPEEIKDKKMITVAVLGMYDVGKSWFCNEFSNSQQYASGYSQTTSSLNFVFPTEAGNLIGLIDTPGSNEAIRVTDEELLKMIRKTNNQKMPENEQEEYFWQYKQLKNDAKILQDLKERFIADIADVVILICNKLSEKEQEMLYKMAKNFLAVMNARNQKAMKEGKKGRDTNFLIVHNYKNLTKITQVKEQIKKDLIKSFNVEPTIMFNSNIPAYQSCNQEIYKDQFGVNHLLLACKNSEAGNYYNPSTFGYIKHILNIMDNRTTRNSTDVAKSFYNFCNSNIPNILKRSDLKLEYNEEASSIFKEAKSPEIALENLQYDEFGNFSISVFEPRYSIDRKDIGSGKEEVIVDIELLDSDFVIKFEKSDSGESFVRVTGKKIVSGCDNRSRECGDFNLKIPVAKGKLLIEKKRIPTSGPPDKGILRCVLTFGPEESGEF